MLDECTRYTWALVGGLVLVLVARRTSLASAVALVRVNSYRGKPRKQRGSPMKTFIKQCVM